MEMTRRRGRKTDKNEGGAGSSVTTPGAGRDSVTDNQGMPILSHSRTASYGSCDDNRREGPVNKQSGLGHALRHQIGSDVLDFGESALMRPGPLSQRLLKKKPSKVRSWLGISSSHSRSEATLKRKDNVYPPVSSMPQHNVDHTSTKPQDNSQNVPITNGKSVFLLFDLDASQVPTRTDADTNLVDLTNRSARPRANAVSMPHTRAELFRQTTQAEVFGKPRCLSVSKYLEEISMIGANGAPQPEVAAKNAAVGTRPSEPGVADSQCELPREVGEANPQQPSAIASPPVTKAIPITKDDMATFAPKQDTTVTSQQMTWRPSKPVPALNSLGSTTSPGHDVDEAAKSNASSIVSKKTSSSAKRDSPTAAKPTKGSKLTGATSMVRSPIKPQRLKSAARTKQAKSAQPFKREKDNATVTSASPGFAGMLQAADRGVGQWVDSK